MEFVAQQKVPIVLIPFSEGLSGLHLPFLYPFVLVFITSDSSAKVSQGSSIFKNTLICLTKCPEDKLAYDTVGPIFTTHCIPKLACSPCSIPRSYCSHHLTK